MSAIEQPGREVGQQHLLVRRAEDVGALRHEVDAAEHDVIGLVTRRRRLRELERVADRVGELDDFVALVVMPEDHQARAQGGLGRRDPHVHLGVRQAEVLVGQRLPLREPGALEVGQDLDLGHLKPAYHEGSGGLKPAGYDEKARGPLDLTTPPRAA